MPTDTAFETLVGVGDRLRETAPGALDAEARRLLASILAEPRSAPAAPKRRRWLVTAVAVTSVAVVAAAWALLSSAPDRPAGVICYAAPDLDADRFIVTPDDASGYVAAACAEPFERGVFTAPGRTVGEVPDLQGCVDDGGLLSVFPTEDEGICARFGLVVADLATDPGFDTVVELQQRLSELAGRTPCLSLDQAERAAIDTLADLALDWAVEVGTASTQRPCASFAIDDLARTVSIIPVAMTSSG